MNKEITIEIDHQGNCSMEGKHFNGVECERYIRELQNVLGRVQNEKRTDAHQICARQKRKELDV